mmetsp:Transcript_8122/g.10708  ORF Transcript_8122/g.10708 Transcript_8122/m.10708 type:complete len:248 (+) Transcript_8122:1-744(+)
MNALKSELNNSAGQEKARVIQREIADSSKIHDLSTALEKRLHEVSNLKSDLSAREEEIESLRNKVSELTITLEESSSALSNAEDQYAVDIDALTKERETLLRRIDGLSVSHSLVINDLTTLKRSTKLDNMETLVQTVESLQSNNVLLGEERDLLEEKVQSLHGFIRTLVTDMDTMRDLILKQERDMKAAAIVHQRMLNAAAKSETELHAQADRERKLIKGILDDKKVALEGILLCTDLDGEPTKATS